MTRWHSIKDCVPWLRHRAPYFVHRTEEERLRADLTSAGFALVLLEGAGLDDERALLERLGKSLGFPGYYGVNWDAYSDCARDLAMDGKPLALVWRDADVLMQRDLHGFVRAVHQLLGAVGDLSFQMEVFLIAEHESFRNSVGKGVR